MSWRSVIALLILAFAGGAAGFAWLSSDDSLPWMQSGAAGSALPDAAEVQAPATGFAAPTIIQPSATQAEAMLLVLKTRQAIEAGTPLGDLGSRLQVTFGQAQPQALATIANGARQPVSNAKLLESFDAIAPQLALPTGTAWDRIQYEVNTLYVLRSSDARPAAGSSLTQRIRTLIIAGDIASAARIVQPMPGAALAADWLAAANRAIAVYQALDVLNQSAAKPATITLPPTPIAPALPETPVVGNAI